MNNNELDLKKLSIDAKTQDEVMEAFGFKHFSEAMECGMLILSSFAQAKKQGCDMLYFHRLNGDKHEYLNMDYIKLIEYIKTRPNDTCVHTVKINKYE